MEQSQKVLQCLYCGNKTLMNKVGDHQLSESDEHTYFYRNSRMYVCPVCNRITFTEEECFSEDCGPWDEDYPYEKIIFPVNSLMSGHCLPNNIKEAFEASLKVKNIDAAICLIALRRTLELVCKDKEAKGKNLSEMIESLSSNNILPPALIEVSTITRLFGNIGAHDNNGEVSAHEINQVAEFVEYILDYLYILPAKIESLQRRLDINVDKSKDSLEVV
ncbi:MAG: DUF4145 domain-containing protein [Desulfitobacteriaceae bacterium]|nr:DUF4145 domain-containing protein [Desulfitobacteriaceae bacterium]